MNDQEIAEAVVVILDSEPAGYYRIKLEFLRDSARKNPELYAGESGDYYFVREWAVVGALMEKVRRITIKSFPSPDFTVLAQGGIHIGSDEAINESLPRAIIEACVAALKGKE